MTVPGPGSELGGFLIEEQAGRGGMGIVYRARQLRPQRTVALKVIAPELANTPGFRSRFEYESEVAAQIEHPNVIPVYAVGEEDGIVFIAMRFVVGTDLRAVLGRDGRLAPLRAAQVIDQVAQALDAAHAHGLVHRDVKPSNVLIATSGGREHAYLTDFGLARHVTGGPGMTETGALVGTIDYIAPEQVRGNPVDARTDVYSLGCMLFQSLTGTVPFPLDNDLAKLYAHGNEPPPSLLQRSPDLPPAFDQLLARAMAKEPADRFPSAGDLGQAAVAAATNAAMPRAERSVASGAAAPTTAPVARATSPAMPVASPPPQAPPPHTPPAPTTHPPGGSRRGLYAVVAAAALVAIAIVVAVLVSGGGGNDKASTSSASKTRAPSLAPPGNRVVAVKGLRTPGKPRFALSMSVPTKSPAGASELVPLTMSLLASQRSTGQMRVIERRRLPSNPYRYAKDSYFTDYQFDRNPDGSGNVGMSWYLHPGDKTTITCYTTVSLKGISLNSCG